MISPTQLHPNQIDYVSLMHLYYIEQHLSEPNTDSQSHLNMNDSEYASCVDHLVESMNPKRKPFEPIELGEQRQINPLDFPTYNTDGTLWEPKNPNDEPKFTFTYADHHGSEKPPYPKYTIICYGKETMLNIMEKFDGYSYSIN